MSKITVCLDCPSYQKGGYCPHKRKEVSALDPACAKAQEINNKFNPEEENIMTQTTSSNTCIMKHCSKCGKNLPLDAFGKKKGTKDGLQYWCKACTTKAVIDARHAKKALMNAGAAVAQALETKPVVVRETLTDQQMVNILREHGWEVTCKRTVTQEL